MSYDIYFLKRDPGQSWEDAMEALEEQAAAREVLTRPSCWDQVVSGVRYILGDVSVLENPPVWEIDHERTGIQVSCFSREWSITVPYWSDGDAAVAVTGVPPRHSRDRSDRHPARSLRSASGNCRHHR